ncbi:MAG TPA: RNA 2',3'-cyclic phosphodiesterase [Gemmatimonadaceae bacterium]|nr:RNA 2',3'-cyclic phosphodiesterase [Gemmatimonadaceae bacterium]
MRLFLAISFEPAVRRALAQVAAPLRPLAPGLAWVRDEQLHLTVKFLGEQPDDVVPRLVQAVDAVAAAHAPIRTALRGVGAFPNFRRARVVWMGMESDPRLELLHHDVEVACDALGFPLDGKPFRPHVTLARVKRVPMQDELRALWRAADRAGERRIPATISSVDLMSSTLRTDGAVHERLHSSPFREH